MPLKETALYAGISVTAKFTPLPAVGALLRESWQVFKQSLLHLILITLIVFAMFFILAIVFGIILLAIGTGAGLFSTAGGINIISTTPAWVYGAALLLIMAFILSIVLVGSFQSVAMILAVSRTGGDLPLGTILGKGRSFVVPFFLTGLLITFFLIGGVLAFVVPVFIFYLFFIFAPYEVVLNHNSYLSALRRSVLIVKTRFSAVLGRVLAIFAIYLAVAIVIPNTLTSLSPRLTFFVNSLSFIVNLLLDWFILVYLVTLYTYAKVGVEKKKGTSLTWAVVMAIIGWIMGILILVGTYNLLTSDAVKQIITNIQNQKLQNLPQENMLPSGENLKSL